MSISINKIWFSPLRPSPTFRPNKDLNAFIGSSTLFTPPPNTTLRFANSLPCTNLRPVVIPKSLVPTLQIDRVGAVLYERVAGLQVHCTSNSKSNLAGTEGPNERENTEQGRSWSTTKILEQLKRYGVSGILSYGLLNTAYYLTTFLVVWFYFAPAPRRMGYVAAASRFLKVMAMVWAGSQVTKLIRAAGALALAPIVDQGLSWFTVKYKFQSRGKAFLTIVGFCLGLAVILFSIATLLCA